MLTHSLMDEIGAMRPSYPKVNNYQVTPMIIINYRKLFQYNTRFETLTQA